MFELTSLEQLSSLLHQAGTENTTIIAGLLAAGCLAFAWSQRSAKTGIPGPPGHWIIGNALDIPTETEWVTHEKWKREYGPIMGLNVFGLRIVILNSPEYINQLLEKRASISALRPFLEMSSGLVGFEQTTVAFNPPEPKFRDARKHFHRTIGGTNIHKWDSFIEDEAVKFLRRIINTDGGERLRGEIRHLAAAIMLGIGYAIPVENYENPFVQDAALAMNHFSETTRPAGYFVDVFPILKYFPSWLPGMGFKREAKKMRADLMRASDRPYEHVRKEVEAGIYKNSFSHELLAEPGLDDYQRELIKWSAISMYLAGSDTTVSMLYTFFLMMTRYPDVQRKAREEILAVIGPSRLPEIKDRPVLPYIDAILKETMRAHPVVPLGGPHVISQDEVLDGHFLKKGTVTLGNIWSVMHDEKYFSDPDVFIPERYLKTGNTTGATALLDPAQYVFGFGKRACPGKTMADLQGWVVMARTLATFEILKPFDANGRERDVPAAFLSGSNSHPVAFDCRIRPYNDKSEFLIQA